MIDRGIAPLGIPLWDQPLEDEHPPGLLLRLAEINGYQSVRSVARETRLSMSDLRRGKGVGRLARIVRFDEELLLRDACIQQGGFTLVRGNALVRKRDLRSGTRRICPACVVQSAHQRFWFDFAFVVACPEHGCLLVDRCPCPAGRALGWKDGRVGGCRTCGEVHMASPTVTPATPRAVAVDRYFLGRFGVTEGRPHAILDALSTSDAIDTVQRIGALSLGGFRSRWATSKNLGAVPHDLLEEGYATLDEDRLPALLERVVEEGRAAGHRSPNLTSAYGWFYHWLNGKGGRRFSPGLFRAVVEHAESRFVVDKRARAAVLPPTDTRTLVEAAKRCGVAQTVMRDILEQRGLIDRSKRLRGQAFRIPEAEIAAIEGALRTSLDLTGVKGALATSHKTVMGLVEAGMLTPFVSGGRETKHAHVFLARDVSGLLNRLGEGLAFQTEPKEGETTLTNAAHGHAVPLAYLCRLVLDGDIPLAGRLLHATGFPGFLVQREHALIARRRHRARVAQQT